MRRILVDVQDSGAAPFKAQEDLMTHSLNRVLAVGLAVAAGLGASLSATPVPPGPQTVEVLIGGIPQQRHPHEGRWYIEALKGREYAVRLYNPYDVRVAVALSVDGLNTIDARESSAPGARKWVLEPNQTITIRGWQTSRTDARRFEFTTEERSYGQALGKTANLGVISAVYFRERRQPLVMRVAPPAIEGDRRAQAAPASPPAPSEPGAAGQASAAGANRADAAAKDEYAATGMGRRTEHRVTQVSLDLEDWPAHSMNIRYEFRPQLVSLGILPAPGFNPLERRERARGFEPGFSPDPERRR
jgi:hypothetical protein